MISVSSPQGRVDHHEVHEGHEGFITLAAFKVFFVLFVNFVVRIQGSLMALIVYQGMNW